MSEENLSAVRMVAVDGRDALAYVIIRPGETDRLVVDAAANGISHAEAAFVLRYVANQWDPDDDKETSA